jgi:membrane protein YdbS with pleckstrin-like domain
MNNVQITDRMEHVEPKVVTYWRIRGALSMTVLLVALLVTGPLALVFGLWWLALPVVAVGLVWLAVMLALTRRRYERLTFRADDELLVLHSGVVFHQQQVIPISRMQHIDTEQGPLERMLGLTRLAVFTSGGSGATVRIPGLSPERAAELREHLLARRDG